MGCVEIFRGRTKDRSNQIIYIILEIVKKNFDSKISIAEVITICKNIIKGILIAESYFLSIIIVHRITEFVFGINNGMIFLSVVLLAPLLLFCYIILLLHFLDLLRVIKSKRFDVVSAFCLGILISFLWGGIGLQAFEKIISSVSIQQLFILIFLPFTVVYPLVIRYFQKMFFGVTKIKDSFFINDVEKEFKEDDLLGFADEAERFAERVFNNGSADSLVFGIDAPWGIGKSTFINFCTEYWKENYTEKVIIYTFNPLRYEDKANLLEKFIDGLIGVIQKESFLPEIRPLLNKYSRFIKTKASFSLFGFELSLGASTIDDIFSDLDSVLSNFDKKIIVVIDDLDRLNFSAINDVLFAIRKCFILPNISYVLCYDTENISALVKEKIEKEKVTEFLEKFINVKVSLFLGSEVLQSYVSVNLARALSDNSQADPKLVSKAMGGLIKIFRSEDFHLYLPFVGDVRKLKRLINTLLLLEIDKIDFEICDFNNEDLIHLLLIYINYPNIFRKICNTETQGKNGYFSALLPLDNGYPESSSERSGESIYKNSNHYKNFISSLSDNDKFLLNKVFDVSIRLKNTSVDRVTEDEKHTYACFNGGWTNGRNLEGYIKLILKLSRPQRATQHRFYVKCKNEIQAGETVEKVLSQEEFSYFNNENNHEYFWRVVTNSSYDFDKEVGAKLIEYLLNNIQYYSLFTDKEIGLGLRDDLCLFLVKLLNIVGWSDEKGGHSHNVSENISEIAEWIFGEGKHLGHGVIEKLSQENRGLLGLYDLLVFRLFCCVDRGGDVFDVQRALSEHGNPSYPTEGRLKSIVVDEMREITQKIFQIFVSQYIDKKINIFELADEVTLSDFTGKYNLLVEQKIASGEVKNLLENFGALKSRVISFVVYQLGNSFIDSGIGCGFYDLAGNEDGNGIKTKMNDYLFSDCFNPEKNLKNYEYFVNYLLINFVRVSSLEKHDSYAPSIKEFTKVILEDRLVGYWKMNRVAIKALELQNQSKVIYTGNYSATYNLDIEPIYKMLDDLCEKTEVEI